MAFLIEKTKFVDKYFVKKKKTKQKINITELE